MRKIVIIESPYAGETEKHLMYVRQAMRDTFIQGDIPFASHALYTQPGVLRDDDPAERKQGIEAGFAFWDHASYVAFYYDLGWSRGMLAALERARVHRIPHVFRSLPSWAGSQPSEGCTPHDWRGSPL